MVMRGSGPRVLLLLVLVFLAGAAGGIAADRLWLAPASVGAASAGEERDRDRDRRDDRDGRGTVIERFAEELGLTPDQRSRIDTILEHHRSRIQELWANFRPRYRAAVDSARAEIESVLEPAQVERYRQLLRKRDDHDRDDDDDERREGKVKSDRSDGNEAGNGAEGGDRR